jgi:hypothetical protein
MSMSRKNPTVLKPVAADVESIGGFAMAGRMQAELRGSQLANVGHKCILSCACG